MVFEKGFREFCSLLNEEKIGYLIVGGYAEAFHGAPRATGDIERIDERVGCHLISKMAMPAMTSPFRCASLKPGALRQHTP
jgi:hypothetical protein